MLMKHWKSLTTAVCTSIAFESTRNIDCLTAGAMVTWPSRSGSPTSRSSSISPNSTSPMVTDFFALESNFAAEFDDILRLTSECFDELGLMGNFSLDMLDRWTSYLQLAISSSSSFSLECRESLADPDGRRVRSTDKMSMISSPLHLAERDNPDPPLPREPDANPAGENLLGFASDREACRPRSSTGSGTVVG